MLEDRAIGHIVVCREAAHDRKRIEAVNERRGQYDRRSGAAR
jgi:hypothetical protein